MEFAACCTNQCAWKCCQTNENNKANIKKFGYNVRTKMNIYDSSPLISERSVYLNENNQTTLKLGCSPDHFFEVFARLESKTKNSVKLTSDELTDLIEFLSKTFDINNTWKLPYEKQTSGMKFVIDMKQTEPRIFSLHIGRKYLTIDEDTLNTMLEKKSYIQHYILLLEQIRKSYESMLFNLVSHFCYENKSLKYATDLARSKYYVQHFFDEILNFHAGCIDKTFSTEIGANFMKWFTKCVPIFIKTTMLNETNRLDSFSSREWKHDKKYINVKKLAKSGLYFTGERDVVGCAFCNVQLHDWKTDDNPILDHYKYAPKCPFLSDPKRSPNVPIGDVNKIQQLFAILPKDHIYDEPEYRN